jgi:hypothetical protein
MREWKQHSSHSQPWHWLQVACFTLRPFDSLSLQCSLARWIPRPVSLFWRRGKSFASAGNRTPNALSFSPIPPYTDTATFKLRTHIAMAENIICFKTTNKLSMVTRQQTGWSRNTGSLAGTDLVLRSIQRGCGPPAQDSLPQHNRRRRLNTPQH